MTILFGTDGIRGNAGSYPLDDKTVFWIGSALTSLLKRQSSQPKIIIGRDTRESGPVIENNLQAGIQSSGGTAHITEIIPTPGIAYIAREFNFNAGIIISASHNPYQDNGIKIFNKDGFKLHENMEKELEEIVLQKIKDDTTPYTVEKPEEQKTNYLNYYKKFLISLIDAPQPFAGYKVVLDCANGAAYQIAPSVFRQMGADVEVIFSSPNGKNINSECGALFPQAMSKKVVELGANMGVAFDGDGDRAIFSDHNGNILDGDHILMICARYMKKIDNLSSNKIIATVMSNLGLEYALAEDNLEMIRVSVGDKHVINRMTREGANLGGEQSGHIIFSDLSTSGDGIITAIKIMDTMRCSRKKLSQLAKGLVKYPQILLNVPVKNKPPLHQLPEVAKIAKDIEKVLNGKGRLLLRYSGTESVARIMIEGSKEEEVKNYAQQIAKAIKKEIGS